MFSSCGRLIGFSWVFVAVFILVGCGGDGATEDKLAINVYIPESASTSVAEWNWVRVSTTTQQGPCQPYFPLTGGTFLQLPPIQFGQDFQVTVEMFSGVAGCEQLRARGTTSTLEILSNDAIQAVSMMVSPVGQFVSTSGALTAGARTEPFTTRFGASTTVLPDGRVVIIGGAKLKSNLVDNPLSPERIWDSLNNVEQIYDTVEIYDPSTGVFESLETAAASSQTTYWPRMFHQAVYMKQFDRIAVIGGFTQTTIGDDTIFVTDSIELFDPNTRQFLNHQTVGSMNHPRVFASADVLEYGVDGSGTPNEFLLVVGGTNDTELATEAQSSFEVIKLQNELNVLDYGSTCTGQCVEGKCSNTGLSCGQYGARYKHKSIAVKNNSGASYIYFIGGENSAGTQNLIDIFHVNTGRFVAAPAGSQAPSGLDGNGRVEHELVYVESPVSSGQPNTIYVIGGFSDKERKNAVSRIEVINTENGSQYVSAESGFNMVEARGYHKAVMMENSAILVTGGMNVNGGSLTMLNSSEIIGPVFTDASFTTSIIKAVKTPFELLTKRFLHNMVYLQNQQVLVLGGLRKLDNSVDMAGPSSIEVYPSELYTFDPTPLVSP